MGLKRRVVQYYEKGERDGKSIEIPKTVRLACFALFKGAEDYDGPPDGSGHKSKRKSKADSGKRHKDKDKDKQKAGKSKKHTKRVKTGEVVAATKAKDEGDKKRPKK